MGQLSSKNPKVVMDDAIINNVIDFPDLNAEVDLERIKEDSIAVRLAQQFPLVGEEVGLTLFGFDLNVPPTMHQGGIVNFYRLQLMWGKEM